MTENSVFDSMFLPLAEVQKSPSGAELLNRTGLREPVKTGPGKTGRPRKSGNRILANKADPKLTNIIYKDEAESIIQQGCVLQVVLPDGKLTSLVLMQDTRVGVLVDPE